MSYTFELKMNRYLHDLNPVFAGSAVCPPNGIGIQKSSPCTLIHYVTEGRGTYYSKGHVYHVTAGQAFITAPNEPAHCQSDEKDPWSYQWVGFTGELSSHFWSIPPVFTCSEPAFPHLKNLKKPSPNLEIELAIDLMSLYAKLILPKSNKHYTPNYPQAVIDFIQAHYMENLTIQQIADHVGLNRDYLYRLFKEKVGTSIQAHLLEVRILEAKRLLSLGNSVDEAGKLCGFNSLAHFSRQFKRFSGQSPQQWVKEQKIILASHKNQRSL